MIAEDIRKLQGATPFVPYRISLSDGKELYVKHPDYLLISPGNQSAFVYSDEIHYEIVAVANITRVSPGPKKTTPRRR